MASRNDRLGFNVTFLLSVFQVKMSYSTKHQASTHELLSSFSTGHNRIVILLSNIIFNGIVINMWMVLQRTLSALSESGKEK